MVIQLAVLFASIIIHEVAHGYVAWRLGDPTARYANRITRNPLAHIDLFGSILLPLILVLTHSPVLLGWAKPVPFNPAYFRDPKKGIMMVGAAGPLTNLTLAAAAAVVFRVLAPDPPGMAAFALSTACAVNVVLAIFNLVPIPPLDGSRVLLGILPPELQRFYFTLERFGFVIVFVLLWIGALDFVLDPINRLVLRFLLGR